MTLRLRRGTNAERMAITPETGEPVWTTDTDTLYIGDGSTAGGVAVGGSGGIIVEEDGTALTTAATTLNFVGTAVTATGTGAEKTITITNSGSSDSRLPTTHASGTWLESDGTNWLARDNSTARTNLGLGSAATADTGTGAGEVLAFTTAGVLPALDASALTSVPVGSDGAPLASPALTGTPTAPTAASGTNTTQLATTEFVTAAVAGSSSGGGGAPSAFYAQLQTGGTNAKMLVPHDGTTNSGYWRVRWRGEPGWFTFTSGWSNIEGGEMVAKSSSQEGFWVWDNANATGFTFYSGSTSGPQLGTREANEWRDADQRRLAGGGLRGFDPSSAMDMDIITSGAVTIEVHTTQSGTTPTSAHRESATTNRNTLGGYLQVTRIA